MKLRLLNGTHSAIAYIGQLRGLPTVSEAMADYRRPLCQAADEGRSIVATVAAPPDSMCGEYCDALLQRFENRIWRTAQANCNGRHAKVPVRWLPPLRESLRDGVERKELERVLACWLLPCCRRQRSRGSTEN
jgi:fructuronate reductase